MKIEFINNNYVVYLNKYNTINLDFSNTRILENDLKKILLRLKKYYKLDIKGSYNVIIYIDDYYGVVLEICEDDNYYEYFSDGVSLRLKKIKTKFKYQVEDISNISIDRFKIDSNDDNIYLEIIDYLGEREYLELLEYSKIVYDKI